MREPDAILDSGNIRLYCGDCLEILPTLEAGSVDAVVTDPPYGINTKSDGMGKLNPWADLCNSALWYKEWISMCRSLLAQNGCLWSCFNWRSMVTFQKASCDIVWPIESLLVWDKQWIGPGGLRGLRPSYELCALWAMPEFAIKNRGLPDVQRFKWCGHKPNGHPAEKPQDLMAWLIEAASATSVLDPFMGSGTTGVACVKTGRKFIGIELDRGYFDIAVKRIEKALAERDAALPLGQ